MTQVAASIGVIGQLPYGWRKLAAGTALCVLALATCVLVARRLTSASWPLEDAHVGLVFMGGAAYLVSFGFRALGWRQFFPSRQRPDCARCLASCGAAAASGAVLPFRLDYLVKIAMLRRLRGVRLELDTIVLSIVTLGMVDAVVLLPLAIAAIATSGVVFIAPLAVVILFCVCCLGVLVAGPRLVHLPLVHRSRRALTVCERVAENSTIRRSTFVAGAFLLGCWTSRALGSTFLLMALGAPFSPMVAVVVLCMAGAAAILPITSGGAVAGMGATAGVLFALGVSKDVAINFSLASGLLITLAALTAAVVGTTASVTARR
ncbi:MAG TPA: lysylphosphatidylglycerol synthase domain-containing protein [Gaiellaceae bacterium]